MKRNLLKGIVLISIIVLSSCSVTNKLAGTPNTGDDVYHTKAASGDQIEYADVTSKRQNSYNPDNDYYYYGDYASRINRFSYSSPFDYDDDFYFSNSDYTPYTSGASLNQVPDQSYDYVNSPVQESPYNFGVYSPFDFGYYDFGGYDDFDYGGGYIAYLSGGGGRRHNGRQLTRPPNTGTGGSSNPPLTFHRANTGNNPSLGIVNSPGLRGNTANTIIYPGRPVTSVATNSTTTTYNNSRPIRQATDNPRPVIQTQSVQPSNPSPSTSNTSSSSGGSSGGSSGSGGGGRPVRP